MLSPEIEFIKNTIEAEAWQKNYSYVVTEHLLLGLLINSADVKHVLDALAVDTDDLQTRLTEYLDQFVKSPTPLSEPPIYTQACERIFRRAVVQLQSSGRGAKQVESLDLLVSLMNDKDTYAVQLLLEYGLTRLKLLRHISHQSHKHNDKDIQESDEPPVIAVHVKKRKPSPLTTYAQNLNKKAEKGKTDPLIGRSAEIERVAHILCRRRKNNPLLVGDPGVGKTAIAEGLAWLIVNQKVAPALQNATIYSLDVGALVAGTKYRGDFEARMKELLDDLKQHPDAILFIDEIHTIIGAGSSMEGNMDMSNLVKPALANGSLRCIGSTTFEEFRQVFEKDHALTRRFQKVDVKEPSIDDSIDILQGLKSHYENFHHVEYSDEAIRAAVELSVKHIHERFLPDKAIDVIDEAGARVRLKTTQAPKAKPKPSPTSTPKLEKSTADDIANQLSQQVKNPNIRTQILRDLSELIQFIDKTAGLLDKEQTEELPFEAQDEPEEINNTPKTPIGVKEIEEVIASIARIPPKSVSSDDLATLSTLKDDLKRMVFGQDEAIDKLSDAIILSRAGLKSVSKPIGSFMFAGPTGVGKTEIARQLAFTLGIPLIRFDMSEYMEAHTVSRLIGSPPGYVGHDKGGLLTEKIHQSPHAVLLLDELEKAHSDIYNILLQVMDHGTLTDNNGRSVSFRQVILIMTTNVGADSISRNSMGFTKQNHTGDNVEAMKRAFSPEFRNRLDAIVQFAPLGTESLALVVDKFLIQLQALLDDKNVAMTVSDSARAYLAKKGYDPLMGARPMSRLIDDELKKPLAQEILFGRLVDGGQVLIDENDGELIFEIGEMATV